MTRPVLEFGNFRLWLSPAALMRGDEHLELPPKSLQILKVLATRAGRVVSKGDLLDLVWPECDVEEGNLSVQVCTLRKVLGRDAQGSELIKTVPRCGYIFTGRVEQRAEVTTGQTKTEQLCLLGNHYGKHRTVAGCERAWSFYRRAMAESPADTGPLIGLSQVWYLRFELGLVSIESAWAHASNLLTQASRIDPAIAEAWILRAQFTESFTWNWEEAEQLYLRAVDLEPLSATAHAFYGRHLARRGRFDDARKRFEKALELDFFSAEIQKFYCDFLFLRREFAEGLHAAQESFHLNPDSWLPLLPLGRAYSALGNSQEAISYLRRAMLQNPESKAVILAEIGYTHAAAGEKAKARAVVQRLEKAKAQGAYVSPVALSRIHSQLCNPQASLESIREACARKDMFVSWIGEDPRLDRVRAQPVFAAVLKSIRL